MSGWEWCSNAIGQSKSTIWLAWDPNKARVQVIERGIQQIHGMMQVHNRGTIELTVVYGLHSISA